MIAKIFNDFINKQQLSLDQDILSQQKEKIASLCINYKILASVIPNSFSGNQFFYVFFTITQLITAFSFYYISDNPITVLVLTASAYLIFDKIFTLFLKNFLTNQADSEQIEANYSRFCSVLACLIVKISTFFAEKSQIFLLKQTVIMSFLYIMSKIFSPFVLVLISFLAVQSANLANIFIKNESELVEIKDKLQKFASSTIGKVQPAEKISLNQEQITNCITE